MEKHHFGKLKTGIAADPEAETAIAHPFVLEMVSSIVPGRLGKTSGKQEDNSWINLPGFHPFPRHLYCSFSRTQYLVLLANGRL